MAVIKVLCSEVSCSFNFSSSITDLYFVSSLMVGVETPVCEDSESQKSRASVELQVVTDAEQHLQGILHLSLVQTHVARSAAGGSVTSHILRNSIRPDRNIGHLDRQQWAP